jgi:hypothetical protein
LRAEPVAAVIDIVSNLRIVDAAAPENSRRPRQGGRNGKVQDNIDIWLVSSEQIAGRVSRSESGPELDKKIANNLYLGR